MRIVNGERCRCWSALFRAHRHISISATILDSPTEQSMTTTSCAKSGGEKLCRKRTTIIYIIPDYRDGRHRSGMHRERSFRRARHCANREHFVVVTYDMHTHARHTSFFNFKLNFLICDAVHDHFYRHFTC